MAIAVDHPLITRFDDAVDGQFDHVRGKRLADRLFYAASEAANHSILWHSITWLGVLAGKRPAKEAAKISLALGAESALVNGPVKMLFRRERPVVTDVRPHALRTPLTSSFPSGHATSGFCAAVLLSRKTKTGPLMFVLAAIVASSRIHVRIHHASDVLAGAAIGTGMGIFFRRILRLI